MKSEDEKVEIQTLVKIVTLILFKSLTFYLAQYRSPNIYQTKAALRHSTL